MRAVIDTDPGIDDLHALLMFLAAEKENAIKIEAITVTAGNTNVENGCRNLVWILNKAGRTDIPIYKGVSRNLCKTNYGCYYGEDGLGNTGYGNDVDLSTVRDDPSPLAINRLVVENPGEITLICLGPLTNIVIAAKRDHRFYSNLKEIFIMGGTYQGKGNITPVAEFNFHFDPESVHEFLKTVTCPTTILPFEPCVAVALPAKWRFEVLPSISPEMKSLSAVEKHFFKWKIGDRDSWVSADACLALIVLHPDAISLKSDYHMNIDLCDETRGRCILDRQNPNVCVVEEISKEMLMKTLLATHSKFNHKVD